MRQSTGKILLAVTVSLLACHHQDDALPDMMDMAMNKPADMKIPLSQCGHPGDKGNALGVGKFCTTIADCQGPGLKTNICSVLGNGSTPSPDDTYFCTIYPCHVDAGTNACGEDATCVCGSGGGMSGCACTPNSCLGTDKPDMGP